MKARASVSTGDDWTDHTDSDPGVTVLELFAFLGEMLAALSGETAAQRKRTLRRYALALALCALIFVCRSARQSALRR